MRIYILVLLSIIILSCAGKKTESLSQSDSLAIADTLTSTTTGADSTSEDDCIFDMATQTDDFVKGISEMKSYTWNNESKTATILLTNGDTLYAQRGGCYHFTFSGRLVTKDKHAVMDTTYWLDKGKWIAKQVFDEHDQHLLDTLIMNHTYKSSNQEGNLYIIFDREHDFSEFNQVVSQKGDWIETEIMYYID